MSAERRSRRLHDVEQLLKEREISHSPEDVEFLVDEHLYDAKRIGAATEAELAAGLDPILTRLLVREFQPKPGLLPDASPGYVNGLMDPLVEPATVEQLPGLLDAPLNRPLPVMDYLFSMLHTGLGIHGLVPFSQVPTLQRLCIHVSNVLQTSFSVPPSENCLIHRIDTLVLDTFTLLDSLSAFPLRFTHSRNSIDALSGTTLRLLRPDFLLWVRHALLFKGEDTALERDLHVAVGELSSKMTDTWSPMIYGNCIFQLAYAAAGPQIQFFAIRSLHKHSVAGPFDLTVPAQRFTALKVVCNIYRVLQSLVPRIPALAWQIGDHMNRTDGYGNVMSRLTFFADFVRKELFRFNEFHARFATFEHLKDVYAAASTSDWLIHAFEGPKIDNGSLVLHLRPIGRPCEAPPGNEAETQEGVRGALKGVHVLHSKGFVHRDVRWPNMIVATGPDGRQRWLLIDYELSSKAGQRCDTPPFPLAGWRLEGGTVLEDGCFQPRSDLKMVATQLLSGLSFSLTAQGVEFKTALLEGRLETAAAALQHQWMAE